MTDYKQLQPEPPLVETKQGPPPAYTGTQPTTATVVVAPQPVAQVVQAPQVPPNDYLVLSIITLLCCFLPLGIIALIKSLEVRSAIQRGDYVAASAASRSALTFNKIGIVIGIIAIVFTTIIVILCQLAWIIPFVAISASRPRG